MVNPILKWAGGKRQLLEEILDVFPSDYDERVFHEPMIGGGAITFNINPKKGSINDINSKLINFYKIVKNYPQELIEENKSHKNNEEYYYNFRNKFNKSIMNDNMNKIRKASLFLYFNRTCYNGLWRENSEGLFNVPFGEYSNPNFVKKENIQKVSKILQNLEIYNKDFEYILNVVEEDDLVYFDPPYLPISDTEDFTKYSKDGFTWEDHKRLKEICKKLDDKGVLFVLSNSYTKPIIELYNDFNINEVKAKRAINSDGENRGEVSEILVTNY
ncbi:MAG: DNA adenine methylase [archaeon]